MNKYISYFIVGVAGLFVLVFIASIFQSVLQPKPVYWNTNFAKNNKQPFGTKIFHEQLPYLFPEKRIKRLGKDDLESYYSEYDDLEYDDIELLDEIEEETLNNDEVLDVEFTVDSSKLKKRSYEESLPYDELEEQHEKERIEDIVDGKRNPTKPIALDSLSALTEKALKDLDLTYEVEVEKEEPKWLSRFDDVELDTSFNLIGISNELWATNWRSKDLIYHVAKGNSAYLSFQHYSQHLKDLVGFTVSSNTHQKSLLTLSQNEPKSVTQLLEEAENEDSLKEVKTEPHLFDFTFTNGIQFHLDSISWTSYFDTIPENAEVLGTNDSGDVVLFKMKIGNGTLYLSTLPHVFSNYQLLKKNSKIAEKEILRLPNRDTYYFDRLTMGRTYQNSTSPSLLTYIHSQPPLAWAFYLLMFGLGIFLLLQIRRIERPIPIKNPPQNLSLGYINTLSDLFYRKQDNRLILKRKMEYFTHQIESQYHLDTRKLDNTFFEKLSMITGVPNKDVRQLFKIYESMEAHERIDERKFHAFNRLIQLFKK